MLIFSEDYEEYTREAFPWKRHTRDISRGDSFNQRTLSLGRNHRVFGNICDSWYLSDQYESKCNDKDITNKVLQ